MSYFCSIKCCLDISMWNSSIIRQEGRERKLNFISRRLSVSQGAHLIVFFTIYPRQKDPYIQSFCPALLCSSIEGDASFISILSRSIHTKTTLGFQDPFHCYSTGCAFMKRTKLQAITLIATVLNPLSAINSTLSPKSFSLSFSYVFALHIILLILG